MSGARFDLRLADGRVLEDVRIQGSGGELGASVAVRDEDGLRFSVERLRGLVRVADRGRPLPIHEPERGHVKTYAGPMQPSLAEERAEIVDIRGASVLAARW